MHFRIILLQGLFVQLVVMAILAVGKPIFLPICEKAIAYHDTIAPMLEEIRYHIDKLELIVDNQMWTLPKYRELLFIR